MSSGAAGISFPFRIDKDNGGVTFQSDNADKLKENIIQILVTGIGERLMRRGYGGGVQQLIHDPNNDALRAIVQHQISKAINRVVRFTGQEIPTIGDYHLVNSFRSLARPGTGRRTPWQ